MSSSSHKKGAERPPAQPEAEKGAEEREARLGRVRKGETGKEKEEVTLSQRP